MDSAPEVSIMMESCIDSMRKLLSQIFSVMLVAATVAAGASAQKMKKDVDPSVKAKSELYTKAATSQMRKAGTAKDFIKLTKKQTNKSKGFASAKKGQAVAKSSMRADVKLPKMLGGVIYSDISPDEVNLAEVSKAVPDILVADVDCSGGGVRIDDYYYSTSYFNLFGMLFVFVEVYDYDSGELIAEYEGDIDNICAGGAQVDPVTGNVYAITYNSEGSAYQLAKMNYTLESVTTEPIADLDGNWNSMAIDSNGQIYGISYTGSSDGESYVVSDSKLCKIDKTTGAVTEIGSTGKAPQYLSSSTIDPATNIMYWNLCAADDSSVLCTVNLSTGVATPVLTYTNGDEIMGLQVFPIEALDGAPAACENLEASFNESSLSGSIKLTTPATTYGGAPGSGEMTVKVSANGEVVGSTTTSSWGSELSVPVTVPNGGKYNFIVIASNSVGDGAKAKLRNVWVGADTPEAPVASLTYNDGTMEVSWSPVSTTVNGGYMNLANLTYTVKRADGSVAAQGLTDTTFSETVAETTTDMIYYYVVYAVCDGLTSAGGETNKVSLVDYVPPYTSDFEANGLVGFTVIDANDDGKTWTVQDDHVRAAYNSSKPMDDWLISPALKLEAGKAYIVSFEAWNQGKTYLERFEVKFGTNNTVTAMTNDLGGVIDLTENDINDSRYQFSQFLVAPTSGNYYIGIHGISDADKWYLNISNISVSEGVSSSAPGAVTNLKAVADASGELKATVSFNAPDKTMDDTALTSLTKIEVMRGGEVIKTFDAPAVGAALSYEDAGITSDGDVEYTVVGYNAQGKGVSSSVTTYVGFDKPATPQNVKLTRGETTGSVILSWDAVTTDVNGKTYPANSVKYSICVYNSETNDFDEIALITDGATTYSFQAVSEGQKMVQYAVFAEYQDLVGTGMYSNMLPVGTPYNGIYETGEFGQYIWGLDTAGGGTWKILNDKSFSDVTSYDNDDCFFAMNGQYIDQYASLFTGLISLNGMENPAVQFYTYNIIGDDPDLNEIKIGVKTENETEYTTIYSGTVKDICGDAEGWSPVTVSLENYANKVVQVQFTAVTQVYTYTMIDGIKVGDMLDYDLMASTITAPEKVKCGEDFYVRAKVVNSGSKTVAKGWTLELYCNDKVVRTKNGKELAPGEFYEAGFKETMPAVADQPLTYYAKVVYNDDKNSENNQTATITVKPIVPNTPVATDLKAELVDNGVKLTWKEPALEGGQTYSEITEDFEDADSFSATYGDWTFVDGDKSEVGGFQNMDIPNISAGSTKGSFWVWDASMLGNETFAAHSGNKYLFALFRYDDGTTDDWAISPALSGDAQTISFWAKSYSSQYPERIEVYYSTGSLNTSDFILIAGSSVSAVPSEWTKYTCDLPAGAAYFAIRSCATGSFMLMVDDVTFTPGDAFGNLTIKGYNVYRNGELITKNPVEETSFVDTTGVNGETYTYVVTVVYEGVGESAASNAVKIEFSGVDGLVNGPVAVKAVKQGIVITNALGKEVTVVAANGALVYNGKGEDKTVVSTGNGVYVVKVDNKVVKVVVK